MSLVSKPFSILGISFKQCYAWFYYVQKLFKSYTAKHYLYNVRDHRTFDWVEEAPNQRRRKMKRQKTSYQKEMRKLRGHGSFCKNCDISTANLRRRRQKKINKSCSSIHLCNKWAWQATYPCVSYNIVLLLFMSWVLAANRLRSTFASNQSFKMPANLTNFVHKCVKPFFLILLPSRLLVETTFL